MLPTRSLLPFSLGVITLVCAAAYASAQAPAVAGHWVGALDVVHADGSVEPDAAYFNLTQDGPAISGGAGNNSDHMSPVTSGKLEGAHLTFDVPAGPGKVVHFDLTLAAGRLRGTATGLPVEEGSTVTIDAQRADDTWHTPSPVTHAPDQLFPTIAALDKRLFDAYNTCDLATMGALVTDDLEFYHDKTGLAIGKQVFLDAIHNNICNKVQRQLIPGTMEVHRLAHFGAVEIGMHRFYHPNNPSDGVGEAKFISIWRFKDGNWQITREISYDHGAANLAPPQK